jgi:hypothetical protein
MVQLVQLARNELFALHAFFVEWMRQTPSEMDFNLCDAAFAPDFRMVAPSGAVNGRGEVMTRLRKARSSLPVDFSITISEIHPIWRNRSTIFLEYVEQQCGSGRSTRRRSSALLTRDLRAPRGMVWRYLQETWIAAESFPPLDEPIIEEQGGKP